MKKPTTIDEYLAQLPHDQRATLEKTRHDIRALSPEAVETISYGMPTFRYRGRPLIHFAAAKNHCAIYGDMVVHQHDLLAGYDTSKGTLRFPSNKPLPKTLLKKLLAGRKAAIDEAEDAKRKRR
jgi:uncharacterized protein YdhG (YjbR/CyaY superfamily)